MDNLRRFVLTLSVIVFLALAIGGFVPALRYDPEDTQEASGDPLPLTPSGNVYDSEKNQYANLFSGNVLYILTSAKKQEATGFVISHYDPAAHEVRYLLIPDNLKSVDHKAGGKVLTLGEYFSNHGGEETAGYLTSVLEIDIPRYTVVTYETLADFITRADSIKCELPYPIKYIDSDTAERDYSTGINYPKGASTLSGDSAVNLIRFITDEGAYLGGDIVSYYKDADPAEIHSAMSDDFIYFLLKGFTDNTLIPENEGQFREILKILTQVYDTNLTENDLDGLSYQLDRLEHSQTRYYLLGGNFQYGQKLYTVPDQTLKDMDTGSKIQIADVLDYQF